jgi:linoleoyl-CoA desaturase
MTATPQVRFAGGGAFHADLHHRVDAYFEGSGRSRHGGWAIAVKVAAMLFWLAGSWAAAVFLPMPDWGRVLLSISIGLAVAGIGFSVMHDANHGATSSSPRLNRVLSLTLDLIGASSALWRDKHNRNHHTYTNVAGADPDLEAGVPFLRVAPWQPRHPWHRFQHLYVWVIYAVFPLKWWFFDDLRDMVQLRRRERLALLAGKAVFVGWAFVVPAMLHPSWGLCALWAVALVTLGNVVAAVFQLAHCVDSAEFVAPDEARRDWAQHQVATTVDFAPGNAVLGWYLGGLNFQVEHHLFARVCHLHYPALSRIVRATCAEHGVRYRCEPTLRSALAANMRWLRGLGAGTSARQGLQQRVAAAAS